MTFNSVARQAVCSRGALVSPDDNLLVGFLDDLALEGDATVAHPGLGFRALAVSVAVMEGRRRGTSHFVNI